MSEREELSEVEMFAELKCPHCQCTYNAKIGRVVSLLERQSKCVLCGGDWQMEDLKEIAEIFKKFSILLARAEVAGKLTVRILAALS